MRPVVVLVPLTLALLSLPPATLGHEGEDHGAPPPVAAPPLAPRATAASEEFELVAVLEGQRLTLHLDRFASNEPVTGAKVEVEGDSLKGAAHEASPGVYVLDVGAIAPARHPFTVSVEVGESADLLSATLDATAPQTGVAHEHGWGEWAIWLGAGTLALAGGGLLGVRRRKQGKKAK